MKFQETTTIFDSFILNAECPRAYIPVDVDNKYEQFAFIINAANYNGTPVTLRLLDTNQEKDKDNDYIETEYDAFDINGPGNILLVGPSRIKGPVLEYVSGTCDVLVVPLGLESNTIPAQNWYIEYRYEV